jgi:hypothetical protein
MCEEPQQERPVPLRLCSDLEIFPYRPDQPAMIHKDKGKGSGEDGEISGPS